MEQERYYFRVGIAVIGCIALIVGLVGWFSSMNGEQHYVPYAIYFEGSVDGLNIGSPVTLKGINVGMVTEIDFESYETDRIRVLVDIADTAPIRADTVATLRLQGITGGSLIALENEGTSNEYLSRGKGEKYIIIPSRQSSLERVFTSVPELLDEMGKLTRQGQKLLSDENVEAFSMLLTSFSTSSETLDGTLNSIDRSAKAISKLLGGGSAKSLENVLLELNQLLVEGKITLREVRLLARTLREDPSVVIHGIKDAGKRLP